MRMFCFFALCTLLSACNPFEFEDLRTRAPIQALVPPDGYRTAGFGSVVFGFTGQFSVGLGARVAVSAGENSAYSVYPVADLAGLGIDNPEVECNSVTQPCGLGISHHFFAVENWDGRGACLGVTAPASGSFQLFCDDGNVSTISFNAGTEEERLGTSAVGLPRAHALGTVLMGAPGADGGAGQIVRIDQVDASNSLRAPLDFELDATAYSGLGEALTIWPYDTSSLFLATLAQDAMGGVIWVSEVASSGEGEPITTQTRACLRGDTPGFGRVLSTHDLDRDGLPELFVGSAVVEGRDASLRIYQGSMRPSTSDCSTTWDPMLELRCPEMPGVSCGNFGASVTHGDINGDGFIDVVVGDPDATVEGVQQAGALFLFLGRDAYATDFQDPMLLRMSTPTFAARLGASLSSISVTFDERIEIIAGAPGMNRAYLFLCSGVDGDRRDESTDAQCQRVMM